MYILFKQSSFEICCKTFFRKLEYHDKNILFRETFPRKTLTIRREIKLIKKNCGLMLYLDNYIFFSIKTPKFFINSFHSRKIYLGKFCEFTNLRQLIQKISRTLGLAKVFYLANIFPNKISEICASYFNNGRKQDQR